MRVTNGIPLGCALPLTGSHCKLRRNTEGLHRLETFAEWCRARFPTEIYTLEDAIGRRAFAPPLEALACV